MSTAGGAAEYRDLVAGVLLPGFSGTTVPAWLRARLGSGLAGVCLFGENIVDDDQVAGLCAQIRTANPAAVIAIDEEGGDVTRLYAATGSPFPGNAVLGRLDDGGVCRGPEEVAGFFARVQDAFGELHFEPERFEQDGERVAVAVRMEVRGRHSGITEARPVGHLWRFRDGRAVEIRAFEPADAAFEALASAPPHEQS